MITEAQMMQIAADLVPTYINVDRAYGNQCWDSAALISQLFGLPVLHTTGGSGPWAGYAGTIYRDYPQTPAIAAAYERIPATEPGRPGDKAIWGDSNPYYPKTHIADVVKDAGGLLLCISQNSSAARPDLPGYSPQSTGPTILQHLPKRGLLGYIRPRAGLAPQGTTTTTTEEGDDMPLTPEDIEAFWAHKLNLRGELFAAGDILVYGRINAEDSKNNAETAAIQSTKAHSEATNAKNYALAAPGLAVKALLTTELEDPSGSGRSFTIADYIRFGWMYAMQAKDKPAAMATIDPDALTNAIEAQAGKLAAQLEITVKEK